MKKRNNCLVLVGLCVTLLRVAYCHAGDYLKTSGDDVRRFREAIENKQWLQIERLLGIHKNNVNLWNNAVIQAASENSVHEAEEICRLKQVFDNGRAVSHPIRRSDMDVGASLISIGIGAVIAIFSALCGTMKDA